MLGLITGSGFDDLSDLDEVSADMIATPFGNVPVASGLLDGTPVLVLRRHGASHAVPPHRIDYRANVQAIRDAGSMDRTPIVAGQGNIGLLSVGNHCVTLVRLPQPGSPPCAFGHTLRYGQHSRGRPWVASRRNDATKNRRGS